MGTRVNRNDPAVATPVPSAMCAAALEAVCHKINVGAGDCEDKLTAKKVREIMSEKRDTNGVLPTETQIKTFYARLTKNKRAVAAPM